MNNLLSNSNLELTKQWNYQENENLSPENISEHSNKKVWWICNKGHEWEASVNNRSKGSNCPYCSGRKASKENCLAILNPNLSTQWHPTKNGSLTPSDVTANSHKKVWWICDKGHEWEATVKNRNNGRNCAKCSSGMRTSFQEISILFYLRKTILNVQSRHSLIIDGISTESDIYIPLNNETNIKPVSIEYDGYYFHKDKLEKDILKHKRLAKDNFFISIREFGLPKINNINYKIIELEKVSSNMSELDRIIRDIFSILIANNYISSSCKLPDINCIRDSSEIYSLINYLALENSFASTNTKLLKEWCYDKNTILPNQVTPNSGKRVWWECSNKHQWQSTIAHRVNGTGCPYCSSKLVCIDNCLSTLNPELCTEWNVSKNGNLTPNDFTSKSGKKVWWICSNQHEWQDTISHRSSGRKCPYCSNKRVSAKNSLLLNSDLVKEWNYSKNLNISPDSFSICSNKKVWWICDKGHEWQAVIGSRSSGKNCPYCSGRKASKENCLAILNPNLSTQWHPTKNGSLTPSDVTANSHKKVWWICDKGHEWHAEIKSRNRGNNCPHCSNHYSIKKALQ